MDFERDITVVVGENDSGKTSLIDVLKIIFENAGVEKDDYYYESNEIIIDVIFANKNYLVTIPKEGQKKIELRIKVEEIEELLTKLSEINDMEEIIEIAKIYGISARRNSRIETIQTNIQTSLTEKLGLAENGFVTIQVNEIALSNAYFLDAKRFENISSFLSEIYFKDKQKTIWQEKVAEDITIEQLINKKLNDYSKELKEEMESKGIKYKLQTYIPDLTEIDINSEFEPRGLNANLSVKLLDNNGEININKKGDGTKRRITMALLEYKKEDEGGASFYVFDEPDTHLHVKAQMDLIKVINQFTEKNIQVMLTTHSPFIINSFLPQNIRLFSLNNGKTQIRGVSREAGLENILKNLGIENTYLFFAKRILLVEGETEEEFIPLAFQNIYKKTLSSKLIKLVKREGITDIPRFAQVLQTFVKPEEVFILIDNDGDQETNTLIDKLGIPEKNIYRVGQKEFEDAFAG